MKAENLLEGRVAQIINERELAINIGREHGVEEKMVFAVLAESPLDVRDPVTDELLDKIDREKVRVKAMEVRSKITICRTYQYDEHPGGALSAFTTLGEFARAFDPPRRLPKTLRIDDSSQPPPLEPEESYVKIGDRIREVRSLRQTPDDET